MLWDINLAGFQLTRAEWAALDDESRTALLEAVAATDERPERTPKRRAPTAPVCR